MQRNADFRPRLFLLSLMVFGLTSRVSAQTQYTVHDLGTLGGSTTQAGGINSSGQVAGTSTTAGGLSHAFRTAANSAINPSTDDLGTLGGTFSAGLAINDSGQVSGDSALAGSTFPHAFRTAPQSAINPATDALSVGSSPFSIARAIDNSGQVVGTCCGLQTHQFAGFRVDANGSATIFSSYSEAYGINNQGQTVGVFGGFGVGNQHAFRSTVNAAAINPATDDLGTLGGLTSIGMAVNSLSRVVGSSDTAGGQTHAFRTGPASAINPATDDLGALGGPFSQANAVNSFAQVVGSSTTAASQTHAFVYTAGAMLDLNNLIPPSSGWTLSEATGINDLGQIVGNGTLNGAQRAFRLDPLGTGSGPLTSVLLSPSPNANGWNNTSVSLSLHSGDGDGSGVRQIQFAEAGAQALGMQTISAAAASLTIKNEGTTLLTFFATSNSGRVEIARTLLVKIDKTPPKVTGAPASTCSLWPPNQKLVHVATIDASDTGSGLAAGSFRVTAVSNEPAKSGTPDIVITPLGSSRFDVQLRADRSDSGNGRIYSIAATATDLAGNQTTVTAACRVPHDQGN